VTPDASEQAGLKQRNGHRQQGLKRRRQPTIGCLIIKNQLSDTVYSKVMAEDQDSGFS